MKSFSNVVFLIILVLAAAMYMVRNRPQTRQQQNAAEYQQEAQKARQAFTGDNDPLSIWK